MRNTVISNIPNKPSFLWIVHHLLVLFPDDECCATTQSCFCIVAITRRIDFHFPGWVVVLSPCPAPSFRSSTEKGDVDGKENSRFERDKDPKYIGKRKQMIEKGSVCHEFFFFRPLTFYIGNGIEFKIMIRKNSRFLR